MRKLDENKLSKLHTAGELLDNKYGELGTESRTAFPQEKEGSAPPSPIFCFLA